MNLLTEQKYKKGGGVFTKTTRIKRENVETTVNNFGSEILCPDIGYIDSCIIGSAGMKETSGDIDILVKYNGDIQEAYKKLVNVLGTQNVKLNKGFNQVSVCYPVYIESDKLTDEFVQIDLIFTDDINYSLFTFGRDRNGQLLISQVARKFLPKRERIIHENLKEVDRFYFSPSDGLTRGTQSFRSSIDNEDGWAKRGRYEQSTKVHVNNPILEAQLLFGLHIFPEDITGDNICNDIFRLITYNNIVYHLDPESDKNAYILLRNDPKDFDVYELDYKEFTVDEFNDIIEHED